MEDVRGALRTYRLGRCVAVSSVQSALVNTRRCFYRTLGCQIHCTRKRVGRRYCNGSLTEILGRANVPRVISSTDVIERTGGLRRRRATDEFRTAGISEVVVEL
jgi:hypothetical protein